MPACRRRESPHFLRVRDLLFVSRPSAPKDFNRARQTLKGIACLQKQELTSFEVEQHIHRGIRRIGLQPMPDGIVV